MHLPHRISAIGAIVGYLHAGHQHRINACSRNILVEKGDIAQIATLEFLPIAHVWIELYKQWITLPGTVRGSQQRSGVVYLVFSCYSAHLSIRCGLVTTTKVLICKVQT